ncbi:MAG: 4Fe-4S ferredoxin [Thermoproteus sp.]
MIEFVLKGSELGDLEALGMAYGLSMTFRRALVVGKLKKKWLDVVVTLGVWGALLVSPCPDGLPCLDNLEKAIVLSETRQMPVGYSGEPPQTRQYRVSTFNRNYLKPRRWVSCRGEDKKYLPLFACIYNLLKLRHDVPIVVSDVCISPQTEERPDFQVLPTRIMPMTLADVVDIAAPPIPSTSIAKGILLGGYKAGPVIAISTRDDPQLIEMGGYLVNLDAPGNPCEVFKKGSVGNDPTLFFGD